MSPTRRGGAVKCAERNRGHIATHDAADIAQKHPTKARTATNHIPIVQLI
jgi:hypothetical protein